MSVRFIASSLVLLSSSFLIADHHQTSTAAEFAELGNRLAGRWTADVTLIADWPGLDQKKGDKLVGYTDFHWAADKKAIVQTGKVGKAANLAMWTRDPVSEQITGRLVNTAGTVLNAVFWKETSDIWGFSMTGSISNGKKQEGSGQIVFADGGKTFAWISDNMTLDGKPIDKLRDVNHRLSD